MGSPFPGMDPYLEGDLWQEVHERLANQISTQLMQKIAPKYVALLAKRYVMDRPALGIFESSPRIFFPDVHVVRTGSDVEAHVLSVATAEIDPPTLELPTPWPVPQLSIEIRDVAKRQLVTIIEILSPANKVGDGVREYRERRLDLLRTSAHMLEIDLLRGGERIDLGPLPPANYYVSLCRSDRSLYTQVWAISLRGRLPSVPVPLLAPDHDVALNLQAALDACFALVGYERLIDYTISPPAPSLAPNDAAWLEQTLREAGLRSG